MTRIGDYIYIYGGYRGKYLDTMWEMNIYSYEVDIVDTKGYSPEERGFHMYEGRSPHPTQNNKQFFYRKG